MLVLLVKLLCLFSIVSLSTQGRPFIGPPYTLYACNPPHNTFPFCNTSLPLTERIRDLIGRLNDSQAIDQMAQDAPAIPELGVPKYNYTAEACHGLSLSPGATQFPQVISQAASFNRTLWGDIGIAVSSEARGLYQNGTYYASTQFTGSSIGGGLNVFGPNMNIFRDVMKCKDSVINNTCTDPRWGRGQETPGEDPFLTGQYGQEFVNGMQGIPRDPHYDPKYMKVPTLVKHTDAYSLESGTVNPLSNVTYSRVKFNAIVSQQDLYGTYLPQFRAIIQQGKVSGLMCAFTSLNGVPNCADDFILNQVMRAEYGFDGYVAEDYGAVRNGIYLFNYTSTPVEMAAEAVKGGCDLTALLLKDGMGESGLTFYQAWLPDAMQQGLLTRADLDLSLERALYSRFRAGLFDPQENNIYATLRADEVHTPEHVQLALEAAIQGTVLLRNEGSLLPVQPTQYKTWALIGPHITSRFRLLGDYSSIGGNTVSIMDAMRSYLKDKTGHANILYAPGTDVIHLGSNNTSHFEQAALVASKADIILFAVGNAPWRIEGEGEDRTYLTLPGVQQEMVRYVMSSPGVTGKPAVAVLITGGPIACPYIYNNIPAVLQPFYPGEQGGNAVAQLIFGESSPAARLPYNIYPESYVYQMNMTNMDMRAPPGHTYRFYTGKPYYEFGYGLSYTNFTYTAVQSPPSTDAQDIASGVADMTMIVNVTNSGTRASDVAVLAFFEPQVENAPLRELFSFDRIHLKPAQTKQVVFFLSATPLSVVGEDGRRRIHPGHHHVKINNGDLRVPLDITGDAPVDIGF